MKHISFEYPNSIIKDEEKIKFLKIIVTKYRKELPYLRHRFTVNQSQIKAKDEVIEYWKKKYQEEKEISKTLKKENNKLKQEIEKITKTNNRYQIWLKFQKVCYYKVD